MSSMYITEPNTSGKVLLHTTVGDIDIELWAKETPKACRNFVQLCLEGYYDDVIFHRIISKFMVQTGDPSGTGQGGESIYGKPFEDETHSRIQFNHRGQIAMANDNTPNSNGSQFFITLDKCEWLKNKHTIFGKVTGNTIFNVLRLGDMDCDADDRPLEPPRIIGSEVLNNPFDDIIPRERKKQKTAEEDEEDRRARKKKKRKGKRDFNVLSFGDEAVEEEVVAPTKKVRSVHDTDDPTVAKEVAKEVLLRKEKVALEEASEEKQAERREHEQKVSSHKNMKAAVSSAAARSASSSGVDDDVLSFQEKMRAKMKRQSEKLKLRAAEQSEKQKKESAKDILKKKRDEYTALREEMKKSKRATKVMTGEQVVSALQAFEQEHLSSVKEEAFREMMTPLEQQRVKYKKNRRTHGNRQQSTLEKLKAFQSKVQGTAKEEVAPVVRVAKEAYHGQIDSNLDTLDAGDDSDDNDENWAAAPLKFKKHIDDNFRSGGFHPKDDDYVTIDPRAPMTGKEPGRGGGRDRDRERGRDRSRDRGRGRDRDRRR